MWESRNRPVSNADESECLDDNTIVEFIDGLLSPEEIASLESHAARCDACRRLVAELGRSPTEDGRSNDGRFGGGLSATLPAGGVAHIDLQAGQEIGRFVILSRIGKGGMGVVFAAYDPKLDRKVAIKLLHSRQEDSGQAAIDAQKRLMREAQAMAQLSHPNVIQVYDVGTYKSEVYIAMEFVDGETLSSWLLRWDRSWQDILDKYIQAGKALADAHGTSLVHRDFKPDNVLVGEEGRVRVMDFGLARWVRVDESGHFSSVIPVPPVESTARIPGKASVPAAVPAADELSGDTTDSEVNAIGMADTQPPMEPSREAPSDPAVALPSVPGAAQARGKAGPVALHHSLTKTGALLGTPRYMAPEQFTGANADSRSDQFSFCVALYEALYMQHPFEGNTAYGLIEAPETTEVRSPPAGSRVPLWLHRALLRGLAASSSERFPSMGALLRELTPAPKPAPSSRRFFALVGVAVFALIAAVYFYNVSDTTRDDLVEVVDENRQLELELSELQLQVHELEDQVEETIDKLKKARVHEVMVGELENRLKETQAQLTATLTRLEKTKIQLDRTNRKLARARRANKAVKPSKARLRGLSKRQIEGQIKKYYRDFDVCVAEWSERQTESGDKDAVFAVRFQVDSRGVPQRGSKTAGIEDQVVYECVVGLLESKLRFPATEGITVTNVGFFYKLGSLRVTVDVIDVIEDVDSGQPARDDVRGEQPTEASEAS